MTAKKGGHTGEDKQKTKTFEDYCELFNHSITEKDLDKWGEVVFKVRRAKEMDIAPLPGIMEVEMKYGRNVMRTRIRR